jgi:REP element-mobilizing transposase RayT
MLITTRRLWHWSLHAYCLMDNHVHLLIEIPRPNLADGIQYLHGTYAREFNKRHRRSGHLFQGRFGSVRIKRDEQLWTVTEYIAMNPVRAGLCTTPSEWPWSSAGSDPLRVVEGWRK